jgi:hypothetical protein
MALAAETDHGDFLVLDQIEIGIPIVIDAHFPLFLLRLRQAPALF